MYEAISSLSSALTALLDGVKFNNDLNKERVVNDQLKTDAINLVMEATLKTKAYLFDLNEGCEPSRKEERELSISWQRAASAIRKFDHTLHQTAQIKALAYADPREWSRAKHRPWAVKLDNIISQCQWLTNGSNSFRGFAPPPDAPSARG